MSSALITRGAPPQLAARKPSGLPTWPMLLLAGAQKTGKSYTSAVFSASDLIDRTFYIEVGEGAIDQYGAIPGARFEVLDHDGTFMSIARQAWAATLVPRGPSGKPHAIVIDSATEVWDLLSGEQQELANTRRSRKANGNQTGSDEAPITMDQWNSAKKRWRALVDLLRMHDGPVIWTARFEEVAVMGPDGKPVAGKKDWKIRTEKNLPFEVDGVIEMPKPREVYVTGIRSLRFQLDPGEKRLVPDFSIDAMLRALGLDQEVGSRTYVAPNTEAYVGEYDAEQAAAQRPTEQPVGGAGRKSIAHWMGRIGEIGSKEQGQALWREVKAAGQIDVDHEGTSLGDRIVGRVQALAAPAQPVVETTPDAPAETTPDAATPEANDSELVSTQVSGPPEPDPVEQRRDGAPRRGVISALVSEIGAGDMDVTNAACEQEFGLQIKDVATKRLRDWMASEMAKNGARA